MSDYSTDYRVVGLASIKFASILGETAVTYVIGAASFHTIANFVPDSAHMLLDPDVVNNFFVEDKGAADCQILTQGARTIEFATRDMGATGLAYLMGGSASNTTCYLAPITAQVVNEKAMIITTQPINGYEFVITVPRAAISTGGDLRFGKSETGTLTVSAVVMQPASAIAPYKMIAQP